MSMLADHWRGGAGEPVLLVHGFSATWHTWGPVPARLAERGLDVLVPTLPGHTGGPPLPPAQSLDPVVDRLVALLDELGWSQAHLAGFSLGGWLALELAKRGRARTVTAVAPGGATTERDEQESRRIRRLFARSHASASVLVPSLDGLTRSPRFRRVAMRDQMVDGARLAPEEAARMMSYFVATPVFRRFLRQIGTAPGLEGLDAVDVPVSVLWGERDRVLPQGLHERFFRANLPHATFRTLPRAGHVPFWEATDAIVDAIARQAGASGGP